MQHGPSADLLTNRSCANYKAGLSLYYLLKQTVCLCHALALAASRQYLSNALLKIHVAHHAQLPHSLAFSLILRRVRRVVLAELVRIHADRGIVERTHVRNGAFLLVEIAKLAERFER